MTNNIDAISNLIRMIGARETMEIVSLAKKQTKLEKTWVAEMQRVFDKQTDDLLANAKRTRRLKFELIDFGPVLMKHAYAVQKAAIESTKHPTPVRSVRLAKPPKQMIPATLKQLREWWDHFRRTGILPKRVKFDADRLKGEYIKQIEKAWLAASEDFLSGDAWSNTAAVKAIKERAHVAYSRAKMIVETETTHYFNAARRKVYDKSDDVSHYLFVAIRDHATTKWCKTRQGLVYAKGDPLLEKETPPVHWNCRSEILPLTRHNPLHLRLIQDSARARRNNSPEPLAPEWTGRKRTG